MKLFNTLTRSVQELSPHDGTTVKMYCCGPTVYSFPHLGNMMSFIKWDILARTIRRSGLKLTHVMNVTDVGHLTSDADDGEDKMVLASKRENMNAYDVARKYEQVFFNDTTALNIRRPDIVSRATEHITEMIELVNTLEAKGFVYRAGGNIYFDTSKFPDYGKMAKLDLNGLRHGSRVDEDANKRNPTDFVVWFTDSKFGNQDMQWDSPWGRGFPGWHLECSAMAMKYLGEYLDIHCGGVDHIAVHHTNEIAQSEAALGHQWVKIWVHGEFLNDTGGKMSKSTGAKLTVNSLKENGIEPLAFRLLVLTAHYRSALTYGDDAIQGAANAYANLKARVLELRKTADGKVDRAAAAKYIDRFDAFLSDDLNTPQALAVMWEVLKNQDLSASTRLDVLEGMDDVLGLGIAEFKEDQLEIPADVLELIDARQQARAGKDWTASDRLRNEIAQKGFKIKDAADGQYTVQRI